MPDEGVAASDSVLEIPSAQDTTPASLGTTTAIEQSGSNVAAPASMPRSQHTPSKHVDSLYSWIVCSAWFAAVRYFVLGFCITQLFFVQEWLNHITMHLHDDHYVVPI